MRHKRYLYTTNCPIIFRFHSNEYYTAARQYYNKSRAHSLRDFSGCCIVENDEKHRLHKKKKKKNSWTDFMRDKLYRRHYGVESSRRATGLVRRRTLSEKSLTHLVQNRSKIKFRNFYGTLRWALCGVTRHYALVIGERAAVSERLLSPLYAHNRPPIHLRVYPLLVLCFERFSSKIEKKRKRIKRV